MIELLPYVRTYMYKIIYIIIATHIEVPVTCIELFRDGLANNFVCCLIIKRLLCMCLLIQGGDEVVNVRLEICQLLGNSEAANVSDGEVEGQYNTKNKLLRCTKNSIYTASSRALFHSLCVRDSEQALLGIRDFFNVGSFEKGVIKSLCVFFYMLFFSCTRVGDKNLVFYKELAWYPSNRVGPANSTKCYDST